MERAERLFKRLRRLPIWQQSLLVTGFAVSCSDTLTFAFYLFFFEDRLLLDLILTAIITVIVTLPISLFVLAQAAKLERLADELHVASRTDYLTRLANRREFMTSVNALLTKRTRSDGVGALLFIDADRFKCINDTYGHSVGDEVLVALAESIGACVRKQDIAARIGGEEFAVFLRGANATLAGDVAERIRSRAHGISTMLGLAAGTVSVSIGVAVHKRGEKLEDVLQAADQFLYIAKNEGRDRIVTHKRLALAA